MIRYGRNFRRLKKELSNVPTFHAPLTHNLLLTKGQGVATFTRATTATLTDFEGLLKIAKANEARFEGARREENLIPSTGTGSASLAVAAAKTMTLPAGDYVFSMGIGTGTATFSGTGGATGTLTANATNRTSVLKTITAGTFIVTGSVATLIDLQVEQVTGQTNQNPSEYVSNGVLSAPWHGAGVDGVKYFTTQNGNTVSSNVVTEATGTAIAESTLKGIQIETSNTNLYIRSQELDNASVLKVRASITISATSNPINGASFLLVEDATASATHLLRELFTKSASSLPYVFSAYVKANTRTYCTLSLGGVGLASSLYQDFNLSTGELGTGGTTGAGFTLVKASIEPSSFGYYRVTLIGTTNSDTLVHADVRTHNGTTSTYTGDGTSSIFVTGMSVIQSTIPSSYIPTTTAAVTRNADVLTFPNAGNVSDTAGTVLMEATPAFDIPNSGTAGYGRNYLLDFGTNNGHIQVAVQLLTRTDHTTIVNTPAWTPLKNTIYKIGSRYGSAGQRNRLNGTAGTNDAFDGSINSSTNMTIGGYGGATSYNWGGNIKNVQIYKKALTDAQIIEAQKTYLVDELGTQLFDESGNALFYY
jgi:hypothetical protein